MKRILVVAFALMWSATAQAQEAVPVTVDNFVRAESDRYFARFLQEGGGQLGKFHHDRNIASVDIQPVIRYNRDVLLSAAVFDLVQPRSPCLIRANASCRSSSLAGTTICRSQSSAGGSTLDPNDPKDLAAVHTLQDEVKVNQPSGPGKFESPNWDQTSLNKVRDALLVLQATLKDFRGAFGKKGEVDPIRHLLGAAAGWGGNPESVTFYTGSTPVRNDGNTIYRLTVPANVPVDGFWAISVYNAQGYFQKNDYDAYNFNNVTAKENADGSVTVQFGGCDGKIPNCLPIVDGWTWGARLYRPRREILNGTWKFPEPQPVN